MDLLDDPVALQGPESLMKRFRKPLMFAVACGLALFVTIKNRGEDAGPGIEPPIRSAEGSQSAAAYDLATLPIFTRTLYYVRENYFDKGRINPRRMLVGALDFLQRDVPEILIDRFPEREPERVVVTVNGKTQEFLLDGVVAPWHLRTKLQEIFRFIQPNLQKVPAAEEGDRLVAIESAATNGMLYTLDPHSVLLDVESFKDMRTTTQGKFGGLGIVIGMDRKSRIVVRKPMPGTPAIRVGLRARDHIVRINNESTVNLTLTEAVERLRGDVGSPVDVYIERDGEKKAIKFTVVRDSIRPPSIDPAPSVLNAPAKNGKPGGKVGYFHMQQFTANSDSDMSEGLKLFAENKVKGVIMDLRGNPGGLYDQAQKVADAFIESGVLVSMVGVGGAQRRDEHASRGDDVKLPLVVLVNQNSASASEIVAGAIKHLDRGLVIGETTFGKGSVQMLFDVSAPVKIGIGPLADDKLGLKLTTAQYLTAGNISIQGVGVTPDIELDRQHVRKIGEESWINLQPSQHRRQEADYEWSLENPTDTKASAPAVALSYLFVPPPGSEARMAKQDDEDSDIEGDGDASADDDDWEYEQYAKLNVDFPIAFARDLLAQTKGGRRPELIAQANEFMAETRKEQDAALSEALGKMGVDWKPAPAGTPEGQVEFSLAQIDGKGKRAQVASGEKLRLRGTMKNIGKTPVFRARAVLRSDNPLVDENEMVFGMLQPGQTKPYDLTVRVARSNLSRTDVVNADVIADGAVKATVSDFGLDIEGKARPLFAYSYQQIDDGEGSNGDGRVQVGEKVRALVTVKNIGLGSALRPQATIRNGPGQNGILISKGRFDRAELKPGEVWPVSFTYEVSKEFVGKDYLLNLSVFDRVLGESVSDRIGVTIAPSGRAPDPATGSATIARTRAVLRESPVDAGAILGTATKGSVFKVNGRLGNFSRVELGPEHTAFVATADLQEGGTPAPKYETLWQGMPPVLIARAPREVTGDVAKVEVVATDDKAVHDVFIRVINRDVNLPPKKAFYRRNDGDPRKMAFSANVPLWPGSNIIQVFAREGNDVQSVQTLIVRRAAPKLVQRTPHVTVP